MTNSDNTIRVFFSQPMHGYDTDYILEERRKMKEEFRAVLEKLGIHDPVIQDVNYLWDKPGAEDAGRLWYLGRSIQTMDTADYIVFHKNYADADGCNVEMGVAACYFDTHIAGTDGHYVSRHIAVIFCGNRSHG